MEAQVQPTKSEHVPIAEDCKGCSVGFAVTTTGFCELCSRKYEEEAEPPPS